MMFTIHAGGRKIHVRTFKTEKELRAAAKVAGFPQPTRTKAFAHRHTVDYFKKKKVVRTTHYRCVWFVDAYTGGGVVAHEMAHMAFFLLGESGVKSVATTNAKDGQEPFCRLLQELVREFWTGWHDNKPSNKK